MRKVFLEDLPRGGKGGKAKEGTINWKESVGYKVPFIWDGLQGEIEIIEYNSKNISIEYKNIKSKTKTDSLLRGKIGKILHYAGEIKIGGQSASNDINNITISNPELVKYFIGGHDEAILYTYQSNKSVYLKCPYCGRISEKKIPICNLYNQGFKCICNDGFSMGHKFIYSLLEQLNINFEQNKRFEWCVFIDENSQTKRGEYDFVIEDRKIIIEVDGDFHREDNLMNGTTKEMSQSIDFAKDKLAIDNGYELIRLVHKRYSFYIEESIKGSKLMDIFNINELVDFELCKSFSIKSLLRDVCEYWNKNSEHENTNTLGNKFKLSGATIREYLLLGNEIGLCKYSPDEENEKRYKSLALIGKRTCSKKVDIFKNGIYLKTYESMSELSRCSEKDFGVKLQLANICKVLKGDRMHHKGFTFKYAK